MADMTPERLAGKVGKQLGLKTTYIERLSGNKPGSPIFDLMAEDVATLIAALESAWAEVARLKERIELEKDSPKPWQPVSLQSPLQYVTEKKPIVTFGDGKDIRP